MSFEIISDITSIETIAVEKSIRDIERLRKDSGPGRWRKMKGIATIRRESGSVRVVELHWYEESSIGKKDIKIKRNLSANDQL